MPVSVVCIGGSTTKWALLALIGLVGLTVSCGYQFAGRGELPGGVQTIAVQLLENRSSETGVETLITNAFVNELNRRRRGAVVSMEKADAVLSGTIDAITWDTATRSSINSASERRVHATVSLVLTRVNGQALWNRSGLTSAEAYDVVVGDKAATENNRRRAIAALSEQMAEYVYRRLTDNF